MLSHPWRATRACGGQRPCPTGAGKVTTFLRSQARSPPGCSLHAPCPQTPQSRPGCHAFAARGRRPSWGRSVPAVSQPRTGEGVRPCLLQGHLENHRGPSPLGPAHAAWRALTEHGHELLGVEVPVAPVGPVAVQRGILLVVVRRLCPKGVDDPDSAPAPRDQEPASAASRVSRGQGCCGRWDQPLAGQGSATCGQSLGSDAT